MRLTARGAHSCSLSAARPHARCVPALNPVVAVRRAVAQRLGFDGGKLTARCEEMELRAPSGERIDLAGTWFEDAEGAPMTWRIKTRGAASGGSASWRTFHTRKPRTWETFRRSGVRRDGLRHRRRDRAHGARCELLQAADLLRGPFSDRPDESGQISLLEDRDPRVPGPRCVDPANACLRPLVLRPE